MESESSNKDNQLVRSPHVSLPFKRHFSKDWSDEKILALADEIATKPKIPWQQITGQDGLLCRPFKYIANGEVEGKKIREVFEPKDRGTLAIYPYENQSCDEEGKRHCDGISNTLDWLHNTRRRLGGEKVSIKEVSAEIDRFLPGNNYRDLFHEFLSQNEEILACEFVCDRLREFGVVLPEKLGKTLRMLCEENGISLERGVLCLRIVNSTTGEWEWLHPIAPDIWTAPLFEILNKIRDKTDLKSAMWIQDFIDVGEFSLAVEFLFEALLSDKIPISQKDLDTLKSIWLDFEGHPTELTGFIIMKE